MRILVTGAAGFIGSHLTEKLVGNGYRVTGLDAFRNYYSPEVKRKNLFLLKSNRNFLLNKGDLLKTDLNRLLKDTDVIFHLAAQAGVRESWGGSFDGYLQDNVLATQRLLEACRGRKSLKKIIFASSSSIYGVADRLPVAEDSPARPFSPYGVTKLAAENLVGLYHRNYGVPAVSLRYFTVYGPRQRPDMAIHRFIKAILEGKKIRVFGNGEQTRDFTYIDDVVAATMLAMEKGLPGGIYNVGGGNRITVNNLVGLIEKITGRKALVENEKSRKGDVPDTLADISKAEQQLGFRPYFPVEQGVRQEINWYKNEVINR